MTSAVQFTSWIIFFPTNLRETNHCSWAFSCPSFLYLSTLDALFWKAQPHSSTWLVCIFFVCMWLFSTSFLANSYWWSCVLSYDASFSSKPHWTFQAESLSPTWCFHSLSQCLTYCIVITDSFAVLLLDWEAELCPRT